MGNLIAIAYTVKLLRSKRLSVFLRVQHLIALNICFADFLLGIYFLSIFTDAVGRVENAFSWSIERRLRTSCSVFGCLAAISCSASTSFMVILTAFRLKTIYNPMASLSISTSPWIICIFSSWIFAIIIAVIPLSNHDYSVKHTIYSNKLFFKNYANFYSYKSGFIVFACRYAAWANKSLGTDNYKSWEAPGFFPEPNFHPPHKVGTVGYYNSLDYDVCLPNVLVTKDDPAWEYTISLCVFQFTSFVFIAVSYVAIYFLTKSKKLKLPQMNNKVAKQQATMQKRIARIIATDFCCWVPICIVAFVNVSGVDVPSIRTISSLVNAILASINGIMNPFLYSPLPDMLMQKVCCNRKQKHQGKVCVIVGN